MDDARELLNLNPDPVPEYLILRDLIRLESSGPELKAAGEKISRSRWVEPIEKLQWEDGSWGRFHSMSSELSSSLTTEQALRRLFNLGFDRSRDSIGQALRYMKKFLKGEVRLRDRREKKHDWDLLTKLFVSAWILIFEPDNREAGDFADSWAGIISHAFSGKGRDGNPGYDDKLYNEAYREILKPETGKYIWGFRNFYVVSILKGRLPEKTESKFLDSILTSEKGIYYIYGRPLCSFPENFRSKESLGFINAYELLSGYRLFPRKTGNFRNWLEKNSEDNGFWDMGKAVKDNYVFPLSESWRREINRKIDCTVKIRRILAKYCG